MKQRIEHFIIWGHNGSKCWRQTNLAKWKETETCDNKTTFSAFSGSYIKSIPGNGIKLKQRLPCDWNNCAAIISVVLMKEIWSLKKYWLFNND